MSFQRITIYLTGYCPWEREESLPSCSTCWCWHLGTVDMGCICAGPVNSCSHVHGLAWRVSFVQAAGRSALETRSAFMVIWLVSMSLAGGEKNVCNSHIFCNITQDQLAFWKVRIGISCAVTYMLWKAWPVISFIGKKLASDNTKMRHRHEFCTWERGGLYGVACNHCQENCVGSFLIIQHGHTEGCLALSLLDPSQIKRS